MKKLTPILALLASISTLPGDRSSGPAHRMQTRRERNSNSTGNPIPGWKTETHVRGKVGC